MHGTVIRTPGARPRQAKAPADKNGGAAKARGPFVPHYTAGVSPLSDLRPTPVLSTGLQAATITAKINAFAGGTGTGRWKNLPRAAIASRLAAVAATPSLIDQDIINACGPALAMYLFARDRTERFVDCAIALYENGLGRFGALDVKGDDLFNHDPVKWGVNPTLLLDWMLLSSLRRTEDNSSGAWTKFDGSPDDGASGITWPDDMRKWLKHGVFFPNVDMDTKTGPLNKDLDHLAKLDPRPPDHTVVLLINVDIVMEGSKKGAKKAATAKSAGIGKRIQQSFPNHYCELRQKVVVGQPVIVWSWGNIAYPLAPFAKGDPWEDAYFGAYVCTR